MNLAISHHDGYVLVETEGSIDDSAGGQFREYVHPLVGQRNTHVIVDMSRSPRITSAGLSSLVLLAADANTNASRVTLAAPTPFVAQVLHVTKLGAFFDLVEDVRAAIALVPEW